MPGRGSGVPMEHQSQTIPRVLLAAAFVCLGSMAGCDEDDDIFDDVDRLDAVLASTSSADASATLEFREGDGILFDRLEVEFELDEDDFDQFDVDTGDGFDDEDVILIVRNGSQIVYEEDLDFDRDRRGTQGDVTWDLVVAGGDVPELRRGDVAEIEVNGTLAVQGTLRRD